MAVTVRTLVISDDDSTRTAADALREFGDVQLESDALTGLLTAREAMSARRCFELLVIDLEGEGPNSQFVLESFKGLEAVCHPGVRAKVVLIDRALNRDAILAAAKFGADACLAKPFQTERLRLQSAELLDIPVRPTLPPIRRNGSGIEAAN